MIIFGIVLSPAVVIAVFKLVKLGMKIHRERVILNTLNTIGVEHATITKDRITF